VDMWPEKAIIGAAHDIGHDMRIEYRPAPAHIDAPPKFWVVCSCGYSSTQRRSVKALRETLFHHATKALEADPVGAQRNGVSPRNSEAISA